MMKILLSIALISFSVYSTEAINVYNQSNQNTSQIRRYQSEQTLLDKLLTQDKIHNLANNIRKDKKNLVRSNRDVAKIDCEIRFICYFNALMQALHASPTFREFIDKLCENDTKQDESYISKGIKKLFDGIESGKYNAHIKGHVYGHSNYKDESMILSRAKLFNEEIVTNLANKLNTFKPGSRASLEELLNEVCAKLEKEAQNKNITIPYSFNIKRIRQCENCKKISSVRDNKEYTINVLNIDHYDRNKINNLERCKLSKCTLTDCLNLTCNVGIPSMAKCLETDCEGYKKTKYSIAKLPKLLIIYNGDSGFFHEMSTPKELNLRDSDGTKKYMLVSLCDMTHYGNLDKTHLVASVRLKDNTWRELNDLLKDGVAPQGITVDFKEMPAEKPVRYRDMIIYEQI